MEFNIDQSLQRGIAAHKSGRLDEAELCYQDILKFNPLNPDANHNMGVLKLSIGRLQEAINHFKTAIEANPKTEQYWLSLINALINLDRLSEAKAFLNQAKVNGIQSANIDALMTQINSTVENEAVGDLYSAEKGIEDLLTLYRAGNLEDALQKGRKLAETFPNVADVHHILGVIYLSSNLFKEAIRSLKQALYNAPSDSVMMHNLGVAYQKKNEPKKAIPMYLKSLTNDPGLLDPYKSLGIYYFHRKDDPFAALPYYKKFLFLNPNDIAINSDFGLLLNKCGYVKEAIIQYNKTLTLDIQRAESYYNLGLIQRDNGEDGADVVDNFRKTIILKPELSKAYQSLGDALLDSGQFRKGLDAKKRAGGVISFSLQDGMSVF